MAIRHSSCRSLFFLLALEIVLLGLAARPVAGDPCAAASQAQCGQTAAFCAQACAWNGTGCAQHDGYPAPGNSSLVALGGPASPLVTTDNLVVFFYGDSITWLDMYEPLLRAAVASGPGTRNINISFVNQGVNGATIKARREEKIIKKK
jgi:hypothetical protein